MATKNNVSKVVFLDRDGVINEFPGHGNYVTKVKDFKFIKGSPQAIARLTQAGCFCFVISNQAGVARGVMTHDKLARITEKMLTGLKAHGAKITKVFYCTHHPDDQCSCRKPATANITEALTLVKTKKRLCYFVGDSEIDVLAGLASGCRTILVLSGKNSADDLRHWKKQPHHVVDNLQQAVDIILS